MQAYSFIFAEPVERLTVLQGVLTKVNFETNMQEEIGKHVESDDMAYLNSQAIGDQEEDADMEGVQKIDDYDFDGFELSRID